MKLKRNVLDTIYMLALSAGLIAVSMFFWGNVAVSGNGFLDGYDDLPLMPGLHEQTDRHVSFDSQAGRIVEIIASGNVKKADVQGFYDATLPQLGWQKAAPGLFVREGEVLRLEFPALPGVSSADTSRPGGIEVRFSVSPE